MRLRSRRWRSTRDATQARGQSTTVFETASNRESRDNSGEQPVLLDWRPFRGSSAMSAVHDNSPYHARKKFPENQPVQKVGRPIRQQILMCKGFPASRRHASLSARAASHVCKTVALLQVGLPARKRCRFDPIDVLINIRDARWLFQDSYWLEGHAVIGQLDLSADKRIGVRFAEELRAFPPKEGYYD
jgi:hypothetical protein